MMTACFCQMLPIFGHFWPLLATVGRFWPFSAVLAVCLSFVSIFCNVRVFLIFDYLLTILNILKIFLLLYWPFLLFFKTVLWPFLTVFDHFWQFLTDFDNFLPLLPFWLGLFCLFLPFFAVFGCCWVFW